MLYRKKIILISAVLMSVLSGCATVEGFLKDLKGDKGSVQTVSLTPINRLYVATANVNVRSAPSTEAAILGLLKSGDVFRALGRTTNSWIGISDNSGKLLGYVYEPLVRPYTETSAETRANNKQAQEEATPSTKDSSQNTAAESQQNSVEPTPEPTAPAVEPTPEPTAPAVEPTPEPATPAADSMPAMKPAQSATSGINLDDIPVKKKSSGVNLDNL